MNEQTSLDETLAAADEQVARALALSAAAQHGIRDETSAQTDEIINRPKLMPGRLRMRRSGRGPAGQATTARIEGKQVAVPACPHLELVRRQVPHPRYGDRVAHFETYTRRPGAHECLTVR